MGQNMTQDPSKNLDNFTLIRGGLYARARSQKALQERVYAEAAARPRGGRKALRSLKNVLCGRTNPSGEVVKLIHRLKIAGVSKDSVRAITIEPLEREIELAFQQYKPAA
jgi:hypothetical protein